MGVLKVRDPADLTGATWLTLGTAIPGPTGASGPTGPTGPTGQQGIATVIVGEFVTRDSADLPVDGNIPADWDGPGTFPGGKQMLVGEALINNNTASATYGDLWQWVGVADPAGWINVGKVVGPIGPSGADGITGPTGPPDDEVFIGPDTPPLVTHELWFDTDDNRILGPTDLPVGGLTYDVLQKTTDLDGDVSWRNVYSVPSGKVIQFPSAEGVKVNLYGSTFGLGITASTLNLFGSIVSFKKDGINGEQFASIDTNGVHVYGDHFKAETDGMGLKMIGGAHIYKQTGGGLVLRKAANTTEVIIENEDGTNRRNIATKPDSEATVAHNATNFDGVRPGQNYIYYNDSIVCWYVTLTPKILWENGWQEVIPPNGYPDFLRPSRIIERWKAAPDSTGNATCVGIGLEIQPGGKVSCWKPGDGPDIKGETIINLDFVYPRNY